MATKSIVRENSDVFVCVDGKMSHIKIEDIIYVEHNSRAVFLYTVNGVIGIPYMTLNGIYHILGKDYLFQCHKSYLGNRIHIESIDRTGNCIILKNYPGTVSVGRKYKGELLREMHYLPS